MSDLGIAAMATAMSSMKTMQSVNISLMKKAMDMTEQGVENMTEMMESIPQAYPESTIDISI